MESKKLLSCIRENRSNFRYRRKYVSLIRDRLLNANKGIVIIMSGLRYVGKSVILQQISEDLKEDCLLLNTRTVIFKENEKPSDFYEELREYIVRNKKKYVLIDEFTLCEGYDNFLAGLVNDLREVGISFVITGSSYLNLNKLADEELGCRSSFVYVQPFTFAEWLNYKGKTNYLRIINPVDLENDIEECKEEYKEVKDIRNLFKEYLENYGEFMAQSSGLKGYLKSIVRDTIISNSRSYGNVSKILDVEDACALLRVLSYKMMSMSNIDLLQDDYYNYLSDFKGEERKKFLDLEKGTCLKEDLERVKNIKNIGDILNECYRYKLIYFYKKNKEAKRIDYYLSKSDLDLKVFLGDYNVVLANLPLFLYYLKDIVEGSDVSIKDLLRYGNYGSFIEVYVVSKYAIAFNESIVCGYTPILMHGNTVFNEGTPNRGNIINKAGEVDIYDKIRKVAIEISISDKSEDHVYFCSDNIDSEIEDCVKILLCDTKNKNWRIRDKVVYRMVYVLFIILLELIDFGNTDREMDII